MPPRIALLNELQIQGDAHAVHENDALVEELLVGDFRVDELLESFARANELDGFGSLFRRWGKFVQHGKIKELKFHVGGNPLGYVL